VSEDPRAELVTRAEKAIVDSVVRWADDKPWRNRELTDFESELKALVYDLERARRVTGQVRIPDGGGGE
jgi:hypothetical protein